MSKPRIGYWNIRGYAQPIRLLLAYTSTDFDDKRYDYIRLTNGGWGRTAWLDEKYSHGLDFPNIPYYIDDHVKLSQTYTILKYLGRKNGLIPNTEKERIRVDLIEAELEDMRYTWRTFCYSPLGFKENKAQYMDKLSTKLNDFSKFLGNRPFLAGDHITYVDFILYELLDNHIMLEPALLDDILCLKQYKSRIESLPTLAAYMTSEKYISKCVNGPMANWGNN